MSGPPERPGAAASADGRILTARHLQHRHRMRCLGIDLVQHAPDVLRLAEEAMAETALWRPPRHTLEPLADVIVGLVDASLINPGELPAHERKIEAAVRYGERRRAEGFTDMFLVGEFAALREGLRRYVERCASPPSVARPALVRLDMAQTVAELAAMRGFHRDKFEQAGLWDTLVVRLALESPLRDLPPPA